MEELMNSGPGIGIFFGMAIIGIILICIILLTAKRKKRASRKVTHLDA